MSPDLHELLAKAVEALRRDINSIYVESAGKKLSAASARDLSNYIKTLVDLTKLEKTREKELGKASQAELETLARELLAPTTK